MIDTGLDKGHPYSGAPFVLAGKAKGAKGVEPLVTYTYSFKTEKNNRYLMHVEEYSHKMLIIKFHLKNHSDSDRKYNLLLNLGEACRVVATCARIALEEFAMKDRNYSFGFIGAELEGESRDNTKRFQLWSLIAMKFFNPDNWVHAPSPANSAYAIFHKNKYSKELEEEITAMFQKHYLNLFQTPASKNDTASVG